MGAYLQTRKLCETVNTLVSEMQSKERVNEMEVAVWIALPRGVMSLWGGLATGRGQW